MKRVGARRAWPCSRPRSIALRALLALRRSQVDLAEGARRASPACCSRSPVEVGQQVAPGHQPRARRRPDPAEGGAEDRGDAGQGHPDRPARPRSTRATASSPGRVSRIDPAVQNGTVHGGRHARRRAAARRAARPERRRHDRARAARRRPVTSAARPFGQEQSVVSLFRLEPDGVHAARAKVTLGRDVGEHGRRSRRA